MILRMFCNKCIESAIYTLVHLIPIGQLNITHTTVIKTK